MEPNDILIRITPKPEGGFERAIYLAVNDEAMVPEMEKTAEFLAECLKLLDRTESGLEYQKALQYADNLARPSPRIKLLHS